LLGADPTGGSDLLAVPGWSSRIMSFSQSIIQPKLPPRSMLAW
jgi:hypothetical protein